MDGIDTVAQLMAMAAITAPKTRGENFIQLKLVDWDFVMGIPLSVTGKSIYFDRR